VSISFWNVFLHWYISIHIMNYVEWWHFKMCVCACICIFKLHLKCYLKYVCMCTYEHSNFYVYVYVYDTERHIPISLMQCSHIVGEIFCLPPLFCIPYIYTHVNVQIFDNVCLPHGRTTVFRGGYFDHHAYFEPLELFWGIFSA
jgi:hypothetical protein